MMTRKHFKAIAEIIAYAHQSTTNREDLEKNVIDRLCLYFKNENGRFRPEKFREYIKELEEPL